jgi:hypothetical protein
MTDRADDEIILPDVFHNSNQTHMYQSGIFRIGVLKKIGKMKTCFFPNQNFHNQKYHSKNGSKKNKSVRSTLEIMRLRDFTARNDGSPSLNEFGSQLTDLYPTNANVPYIAKFYPWAHEFTTLWVSKDS